MIYDSAIQIRGPLDTDDIVYEITETPSAAGAVIDNLTAKDINLKRSTTAGVANDFRINGNFELVNQTPGVISLGANGQVSRLTTGIGKILLKNDYCQRVFERAMTNAGSQVTYETASFQAGSLRAHLLQQMTDALSGVPRGVQQRVISASNFLRTAKGTYVPPATDILDQVMVGGTGYKFWITPYHFLGWRGHGIGDTATSKQIKGEIAVTYSATRWNGTICKLLPANYKLWLPNQPYNTKGNNLWPCFANLIHTYNDPAAEGFTRFTQPGDWGVVNKLGNSLPSATALDAYQYRNASGQIVTGGDSGSSVFCVIQGQLVPLGHVAYAGQFGSFFYADYLTEIQAAVTALNAQGPQTIQTLNLSSFTQYP